MSLPWSSKGVKATPVNADELMILDSADANPATVNKRITIGSLPTGTTSPLTTKGDVYTFDTTDQRLPVGIDGQILSADSVEATGLKWIVTPSSGVTSINGDTTAAQIMAAGTGLNIVDGGPNHTYSIDGTVVTLTGVQTLTNKTLTLPVISDFTNSVHDHSNTVGGGQLTNSALLSGVFSSITGLGTQSQNLDMGTFNINNLANLTLTGVINFFDGIRQTFNPNAANSGLNVGIQASPDPTSPVDGDIYYNTTTDKFRVREGGAWLDMTNNTTSFIGFTADNTLDMGTFAVLFSADTTTPPLNSEKWIANEFGTLWYNAGASQHDFAISGTSEFTIKAGEFDGKDNEMKNVRNYQFSGGTTLPSTFLKYIQYSNSATTMFINVDTAQDISLTFGAVAEYTFDQTQADFHNNDIINVGTLNTNTIPGGTSTFAMLELAQTFTAKQTLTPSATVAGLNVGAKVDPDPTIPVNGDIYYNSTNNKFRVYENSLWQDMTGGAGSQTPITQDIDYDGFDILDLSNIEFRAPSTADPGQSNSISMQDDAGTDNMIFHVNDIGGGFRFITDSNVTPTVEIDSNGISMIGKILFGPQRITDTNLLRIVTFETVASSVNFFNMKGATAGNGATLETDGSSTNIDLILSPKGNSDGSVFIPSRALKMSETTTKTAPTSNQVKFYPKDSSGRSAFFIQDDVGETEFALISQAQTLEDKTLDTGTIVNIPITWNEFRQTFNPNATIAGLNFGSQAGDPSTTIPGDVWYNTSTNKFRANENSILVDMIGGGGSQTPWTSNIDGAGFALLDTNYIEAGSSLATSFATVGDIRLPDLSRIGIRNSSDDGNFGIFFDDPTITFENFETIEFPQATLIDAALADAGFLSLDMGSGGILMNGFDIDDVGFIAEGAPKQALSGFLRVGNTGTITFRNFADTVDEVFTLNPSDQFSFSNVLNMGNNLIKSVTDPVDGSDAATKTYVDNLVNGLSWKNPAVVATTGNITLSGNQTIDGILTVDGDRVLVKDQTSGQFNGVYNSDTGAWTRTTDTDSESDLLNMSIYISLGSTQADTAWVLTTDAPIVVDTTVLNYAQVGAGAGNPLTTKGDIFGYDTANNRIPVGTDGQVLTANSAVALGVDYQSKEFVGPWTANHDAGGFNLINLAVLESNATNPAVSGTIRLGDTEQIMWRNNANNADIGIDVNNDIFNIINAATITGSSTLNINFQSATANFDAVNVSAGLDVGGASITSVLEVEFDPGGQIIFGTGETIGVETGDMIFNVPTTDFFSFDIATVPEYTFSATEADFNGNNLTNVGFIESNATNVSSVGAVRLGDTESIAWRNSANDADFFIDSNDIELGFNGWTSVFFDAMTDLDLNDANVVGVANITLVGGGSINMSTSSIVDVTSITFIDNNRTTFNPGATVAGLNVGAQADPDPTSPVNGDIYYNSTNNKFRAYENSSWVDMIGGAGSGDVVGPGSSTDEAVTLFDGITGKLIKNSTLIYQTSTSQLQIPGAIVLTAAGTVPAGTNTYIREDGVNMDINVAAASSINLQFGGGGLDYVFTSTGCDFSNNTISNANFAGVLSAATVTVASGLGAGITYGNGIKQTFNPSSSNAGLNVGQEPLGGDPATPVNGDIYYNSTNDKFRAYENSTWVDMVGGGSGDVVGPGSSTDNAIAIFDGVTGKLIQQSGATAQPLLIDDNANMSGIRSLQFDLFNTTPAGSIEYIQFATSALTHNVQTGATHKFQINNVDMLGISTVNATWNDLDQIIGQSYIQTQELGSDPGNPGATNNRLYTKDVAGRSHLFIEDDGGAVDIQAGGGDVSGPASSVDNTLVTFDGVTGKLIQGAGTTGFEVIVDSAGQPTWPRAILFTNTTTQPAASSTWIESFFSDLQLNASTGNTVQMSINAGIEYVFTNLAQNFNRNDADQLGAVIFNTAGALTGGLATDPYLQWEPGLTPDALRLNVPSATEFIVSVNDVEEYTFSSSTFNGNGNILQNFTQATLQSTAGAIAILENTQSSPAPGTTTANIRFRGDRVAASAFDYGRLEVVMGDTSSGSADGEMMLMVGENNIENVEYITLNEGNAQTIHFKKNLQDFTLDPTTGTAEIAGIEGLRFTDDTTTLGAGLDFIQLTNNVQTLNVQTGNTFALTINAVDEYTFSPTALDVVGNDIDNIQNLIHDISASGTDIDFDEDEIQTISISANTTFTTANRATGKSKVLKITTDGTLRTLTFPGWDWTSTIPADQAANKNGYLTLTCFSTTDASIVASYLVGSL